MPPTMPQSIPVELVIDLSQRLRYTQPRTMAFADRLGQRDNTMAAKMPKNCCKNFGQITSRMQPKGLKIDEIATVTTVSYMSSTIRTWKR